MNLSERIFPPGASSLSLSFSLISAFFFAVTAAGLSTGRQGTIMPQVFMTGDKEEGARLQKEKSPPFLLPPFQLFSRQKHCFPRMRFDNVLCAGIPYVLNAFPILQGRLPHLHTNKEKA